MAGFFEETFTYNGEKFSRGGDSNNTIIPEGVWVLIVSTIFPEDITVTMNTYTPDSWQELGRLRGNRAKTFTQVVTAPKNARIGINTNARLATFKGTPLALTLIPLTYEATT